MLRNKARKIRKDTGDERWKAPIEKTNKSLVRTVGLSLLRPFQILIFEPMALILNLYSAILLGILYLFFGAFPLVFQGTYGFNLWQTGLTFLGMLVGMFCAALLGPLWVKIRAQLIDKNARLTGVEGKAEPEYRLPSAILGSFLVTVGLFWFGWSSQTWVHWIMPIIGSGIFGCGVSPSLSPCLFCISTLGGLMVVSLCDPDTTRRQHWSRRRRPLSLSRLWLNILCDCGTQGAETDRRDTPKYGCSSRRLATPFPRMVSLFPACCDLAFCISGTLRLTDWKNLSHRRCLCFPGPSVTWLVVSHTLPTPNLLFQTTPSPPSGQGKTTPPPRATNPR